MYPRIFHIYGPLWINGYGLMIAVGFILFSFFSYRHPWRTQLMQSDDFLNSLVTGFVSAFLGGRLLFILLDMPWTWANFKEICYPWVGGFSMFGSVIGVIVGITLFLKIRGISILRYFDLIAIYVPLLVSSARVGCFLAGCCHGASVSPDCSLGIVYTDPYALAPLHVPVHPTQLYAAVISLGIFVIMYLFSRYWYRVEGSAILLYLVLASMSRFGVDFLRGDRGDGVISSIQLVVLGVFCAALLGMAVLYMRRSKS